MEVPETISTRQVEQWNHHADVVVIGQGVAGSCAALEARNAGAEVLIVERASGGGGASAMSSGIFYLGGGTAVQKACGYDDTADEMYKFLFASTQPANPQAVREFCDNSAAHFDWLEELGVPFERTEFKGKAVFLNSTECLFVTGNEKAWPFNEIAKPAPRGHKVAGTGENAGAVAMNAILARCAEANIPALYDTRVTAMVVDDEGRVAGLRARQAGKDIYIAARRGVILATGGFNLNKEMVRHYLPLVSDPAEPLGIPSNDGFGLLLGQSVGGVLAAMDGVIATASIYPPAQLIKGIIVNKRGERFVAEDAYHGRTASFVMEQPDQTAWLIVDSSIFAYPEIETHQHRLVDGYETVAEMETGLGIPTGALQRTLDNYNRDAASGCDRRFFKQQEWLQPLDSGPYAAFDISFNKSIYLYITLGGLNTDSYGRVLDRDHNPVKGLYAAGACTAHIPQSGKAYASGQSLGPGSWFGRIAGRHAATAEPRP
ncbi:MAG: FAD-binding protein [Sphingomonadaceae bacterium]